MIRKGVWHQLGHQSQKFVDDFLQDGTGVGAIISPANLSQQKAEEYAVSFKTAKKSTLWDPQFYNLSFEGQFTETWDTWAIQSQLAKSKRINEESANALVQALTRINRLMTSDAVVAPAVMYEAGRKDIHEFNRDLFDAAKTAAEGLKKPVLASIPLTASVTNSDQEVSKALAFATSLKADGWYFLFEFEEEEKLPTDTARFSRFANACLTLAATNKPVIHGYSQFVGLPAIACGATAVGVGHWQTLWAFTRSHWPGPGKKPGGGNMNNIPSRFFSEPLWDLMIFPDDFGDLPTELREAVLLPNSAHATPAMRTPIVAEWDLRESHLHMIHSLCGAMGSVLDLPSVIARSDDAINRLETAVGLWDTINKSGITLHRRPSDLYQRVWLNALREVRLSRTPDYEWLELAL